VSVKGIPLSLRILSIMSRTYTRSDHFLGYGLISYPQESPIGLLRAPSDRYIHNLVLLSIEIRNSLRLLESDRGDGHNGGSGFDFSSPGGGRDMREEIKKQKNM
jgi:hypothetical protein